MKSFLGGSFFAVRLAALVLACHACTLSKHKDDEASRLSHIRPQLADTIIEKKQIERKVIREYLGREDLVRSIRVVEIFERERPGLAANLKEYRLFNISPHSVYTLLGLQNSDVLVAASDVVVAAPELFKDYVRLLAYENEASIEIRREGKPLVFQYSFVGE